MGIEVLGIDLGKTVCSLADWTQQARSCTKSAFDGTGCWTFWKVWTPALLRWWLAAARITLVAFAFNTDMSLG